MKKELATIKGQIDDELITIGLDDDNRLCASNGDDVHPSPRAYRAGIEGERQAIRDIEAMWGGDWSLEWLPAAEIDMDGASGYVEPGIGPWQNF